MISSSSSLPKRENSQNSFRIKTQPAAKISQLKKIPSLSSSKQKLQRYDNTLYHKTHSHLKPLKNNPELFTIVESQGIAKKLQRVDEKKLQSIQKKQKQVNSSSSRIKTNLNKIDLKQNSSFNNSQMSKSKINWMQNLKKSQNMLMKGGFNSTLRPDSLILVPQTIKIRQELIKASGFNRTLQSILDQDTKMLITAKKWVIYDMETNTPLKGFKQKKQHDIASLTKIMTFYTAFMIIQKYYLSLEKFQMYVDEIDQNITGTKIKELREQSLVTLQDMLYALMLNSSNNAATVIGTNLGSYLKKKRANQYFSCFDIPSESKEENLRVFLDVMNLNAKRLEMENTLFVNVHGICKNKSTAIDMARLMSECFKIPLFGKIAFTKRWTVRIKEVGENGEVQYQNVEILNTNKLLWRNSGCIGGKTGCNKNGGESLAVCYEGNIIVVVLGSAGRQEKFADAQKLIGWLFQKLQIFQEQEIN